MHQSTRQLATKTFQALLQLGARSKNLPLLGYWPKLLTMQLQNDAVGERILLCFPGEIENSLLFLLITCYFWNEQHELVPLKGKRVHVSGSRSKLDNPARYSIKVFFGQDKIECSQKKCLVLVVLHKLYSFHEKNNSNFSSSPQVRQTFFSAPCLSPAKVKANHELI